MTDETLGEPKREMKYNLFDLAKRTFARKIDASYTIGGYEELIAACDEALNWADANARAFPIETAPTTGEWFLVWDAGIGEWFIHQPKPFDGSPNKRYTHWRPLPPPPSNPPLPEALERLGEVLRQIKGA